MYAYVYICVYIYMYIYIYIYSALLVEIKTIHKMHGTYIKNSLRNVSIYFLSETENKRMSLNL